MEGGHPGRIMKALDLYPIYMRPDVYSPPDTHLSLLPVRRWPEGSGTIHLTPEGRGCGAVRPSAPNKLTPPPLPPPPKASSPVVGPAAAAAAVALERKLVLPFTEGCSAPGVWVVCSEAATS